MCVFAFVLGLKSAKNSLTHNSHCNFKFNQFVRYAAADKSAAINIIKEAYGKCSTLLYLIYYIQSFLIILYTNVPSLAP